MQFIIFSLMKQDEFFTFYCKKIRNYFMHLIHMYLCRKLNKGMFVSATKTRKRNGPDTRAGFLQNPNRGAHQCQNSKSFSLVLQGNHLKRILWVHVHYSRAPPPFLCPLDPTLIEKNEQAPQLQAFLTKTAATKHALREKLQKSMGLYNLLLPNFSPCLQRLGVSIGRFDPVFTNFCKIESN